MYRAKIETSTVLLASENPPARRESKAIRINCGLDVFCSVTKVSTHGVNTRGKVYVKKPVFQYMDWYKCGAR